MHSTHYSPFMMVSIRALIPAFWISVLPVNWDSTKCSWRSLDKYEDACIADRILSVYPWAWRGNEKRHDESS